MKNLIEKIRNIKEMAFEQEVEYMEALTLEGFYISNGGTNGQGFSAYLQLNASELLEIAKEIDKGVYTKLVEHLENECIELNEYTTLRLSDHKNSVTELNIIACNKQLDIYIGYNYIMTLKKEPL